MPRTQGDARALRLPRVLALAAAVGSLAAGEADVLRREVGEIEIHPAPGYAIEVEDGAIVAKAPRGFVARMGERTLMGDALRYDQTHDALWAEGRIVYVQPDVRIACSRIGMRPRARTGEAWDVEAQLAGDPVPIPIRAAKVTITRERLVFEEVRGGGAHGGLFAVDADRIVVHLRERADDTREGPGRHITGLTVRGARLRALGVPVLWLPVAHRDFTIDYPWTRFEFGDSRRLGTYGRAWIGSSLPEFLGWRTGVQGRYDLHEVSGQGFGAAALWRHPSVGRGQFGWYRMPDEHVVGGADGRTVVAERRAQVVDAEHRLGLPAMPWSGAGAVSARWVSIPDPDPAEAGGTPGVADERFRTDYLREDLERRPFARRGVTAAYDLRVLALAVDTERRHHPDLPATDRLWAAQAELPALHVLGGVHAEGGAGIERLRDGSDAEEAVRLRHSARLVWLRWLDDMGLRGVGADAAIGERGLAYRDGTRADLEIEDAARFAPIAEAGMRMRVVGRFADGVQHTAELRAGVELIGDGRGDDLPRWTFGDARDELEDDRRYLVLGMRASRVGPERRFHLRARARWALRDEDRRYIDPVGVERMGSDDLVDVTGSASGDLPGRISLTGDARWDARADAWAQADGEIAWHAHERVALRYGIGYLPVDGARSEVWQQRPGIAARAERYRIEADVTLKPGGDEIDRWHARLARAMVDGELTFDVEIQRDVDGDIYDRRYSVGFGIR